MGLLSSYKGATHVAARAIVMQKKTQRPVQFEITEQTRDAELGSCHGLQRDIAQHRLAFLTLRPSRRGHRADYGFAAAVGIYSVPYTSQSMTCKPTWSLRADNGFRAHV